jgi:autotransporter translocation and assembly factor TamB
MKLFKSHWWNPIAALAIILGVLISIAITSSGLKAIIFITHALFPNTIEVASVEGTLIGPIHLKQLKLHLKNADITVEQVDFDWDAHSFLEKKIHIKQLALIKPLIVVHTTMNSFATGKSQNAESSFSFESLSVKLKQLHQKITIDTIQISQLDIQSEKQHFRLDGQLNATWNMSWAIESYPIDSIQPNVKGILNASGVIKGLRLEPQILADGQLSNTIFHDIKIQIVNAHIGIQTSFEQDTIFKQLQLTLQSKNIIRADHKIPELNADLTITALNHGYKGLLTTKSTVLQTSIMKLQKIITLPKTETQLLWNSTGLRTHFTTKNSPNVITASILLPNFNSQSTFNVILKQSIQADLKANLVSIQLLQPFFPDWKILSGKMNCQINAKGTITKPTVVGNVKIQDAKLFLPDFNIQLNDIQLEAQGNSLQKILLKGHALSDGGNIDLTGTASLENFEPSAILTLKGKNFLIYHTPRYQIYASPNIEIQVSDKLLKLTGNISIPKARLFPMELSNEVITLPSEIEILGEKKPDNQSPNIPINTDFQLSLEKNITLKLLGLTGRLEGSLHITSAPESPTLASGELSIVDGQYEAYGQKLSIRKGARLTFANSPIDDPTLYLQAVRTINTIIPNNTQTSVIANTLFNTPASTTLLLPPQSTEVTVGITVKGKVQNPELSLFSEPATFSQSDILSMMLLNQPLDQVSPADAQLLLKAATALSPTGGQLTHIINQIEQAFGVDELNVTSIPQLTPGSSTITKNTSVVIGKRLSSRLYINYSYGLTAPLNILKISYLIGSKWKIQTEANDNANAVDLFYTLETN